MKQADGQKIHPYYKWNYAFRANNPLKEQETLLYGDNWNRDHVLARVTSNVCEIATMHSRCNTVGA
jgi:hypothetical protein